MVIPLFIDVDMLVINKTDVITNYMIMNMSLVNMRCQNVFKMCIRDRRKGKSIVATHNGISLVSVLPEKLTSPILTSDWENNLAEIAKGNYPPEDVYKRQY